MGTPACFSTYRWPTLASVGVVAFAPLLLLSVSCISTTQAQQQEHARFRVSSEATSFAITATLEGEWVAIEDRIDIDIASVNFRLRSQESGRYNGRRRLDSFWVSLGAKKADGTWQTVRSSERLEIHHVLSPNDKLVLKGIHMSIPVQDADRLDTMWLVFAMEDVLLDKEAQPKGWYYAHSQPGIFRRLRR
jgi:hypothetical protein